MIQDLGDFPHGNRRFRPFGIEPRSGSRRSAHQSAIAGRAG